MGKRIGIFCFLILVVVPILAVIVFFVGFQLPMSIQIPDAIEVFAGQGDFGNGVLLADKKGSAFMVCLLENENTYLISILPSATPKGKQSGTFQSVYLNDGIKEVKKQIENSLSVSIGGTLEVDFDGLATVVDALGGVEIDGETLDGQSFTALLRNGGSEQTVGQLQQKAVLAIGRRFCNAGFWKAQKALRKLLRITDTELSLNALVKIGKKLVPALEGKGLYSYCLPYADGWDITAPGGQNSSIQHPLWKNFPIQIGQKVLNRAQL